MRDAPNRRFGAVAYLDLSRLDGERVDVAIVWRRAALVEELDRRRVVSARRYLWLHDNIAPETLARFDHLFHRIMVLSRYHRSRFPQLSDHRFLVTSNGIDPVQFAPPDPPRNPTLAVYGSDYVRGLRALLQSWPMIRAAVPTARLHVFYGWQGLARREPERAARLQREFAPLLSQPGVDHLGRIGHADVAAEYRRAGVWAYPCSYRETSCISAMKAQAGGAVPAVIPTGALAETVRFGVATRLTYDTLPAGTPGDELVGEWREALIDLLRSPQRQEAIRREMMPACRAAFAWQRVAAEWEREFAAGWG
jgi:protein O-GlcNAc transferase